MAQSLQALGRPGRAGEFMNAATGQTGKSAIAWRYIRECLTTALQIPDEKDHGESC